MSKNELKTLPNHSQDKRFVCKHTFSELTSLCPVTKLPDFYTVIISYEPNDFLIELKSLKIYFGTYRDVEIIHEHLSNQIFQDFIDIVKPRWAQMKIKANVRGGIFTEIIITWDEKNGFTLFSNSEPNR